MSRQEFERDGFARSAPLLPPELVARAVAGMDRVIAGDYRLGREPHSRSQPPGPPGTRLIKIDMPHLADPDLYAAITDPRLAGWIAGICGASWLQVWAVQLLYKPPGEAGAVAVGWHQDRLYWPYWEGEVLTAWLALGEVGEEDGPVRMVPGSQRWGEIPAGDFFCGDLERSRQAIAARMPAAAGWPEVAMTMPAGAASLHHRLTVHGSGANRGRGPRRSLAIHLRTAASRPVAGADDYFVQDLGDPRKCPVLNW